MPTNVALNGTNFYNPYLNASKAQKDNSTGANNDNFGYSNYAMPENGNNLIMNALMAMANQSGLNNVQQNSVNKEQVAEMLKSGNKQEVKDKMGAAAVPALMAIVKDTSQSMNVRVDAIATLAKLVDEGKAPASCLVQLLKDPNTKDMAERAMANVGKEIMPVVKQLLNSGDPALKESAKNILNDMVDAWSGYENDPKWGNEAKELLPEVNALLNKINNNEAGNKNAANATTNNNNSTTDNGIEDNQTNKIGMTRQYVEFSKQMI